MPKRDSNGRFIKSEDAGFTLVITLPSFSKILLWILLLIVLSPWIIIILRNQIWKDILLKLEHLFFIKEEEGETTKKNGLFY